MSPLELAEPVAAAAAGHAHVARCIAALAFFSLLLALAFGLMRAKKQVLHDDAEAALEADFLRLERDSVVADAARAAATREGS